MRHIHVDNFDGHLRNAQLVHEFFRWMLEVSLLFCVDRDPMNHFGDNFYNVVRYRRNNDIPVRVQNEFLSAFLLIEEPSSSHRYEFCV